MISVPRQLASGAAWMIAMRLSIRGLGFISTIILARLLGPEDFGLVGMAVLVVGTIEILSEFGFDLALIQKRSSAGALFNTAWTLNVLRGLVLSCCMLAAAPIAAEFFAEPRLKYVIAVLALGPMLYGLTNIGIVEFRRNLEFRKDFLFLVQGKLFSFIVTLGAAFWFRNYWALVIGTVSGQFFSLVLSYCVHAHRPRFSLAHWRDLFGVSRWLLANNIVVFFSNKLDTFCLAKFSTPYTLGLYTVAFEIANLPSSELVQPITRALFPGYVKLASDMRELCRVFILTIATVWSIALPVGVGIALVAEPLVLTLLGNHWSGVMLLLQLLAIDGVVRISLANSSAVYMAVNKTSLVTICALVTFGLRLAVVPISTYLYSAPGAAAGLLAANITSVAFNVVVLLRTLPISMADLLRAVARPIFAATVMVLSVMSFQSHSSSIIDSVTFGNPILELAILSTIGAITYIACLLGSWRIAGSPSGPEAHLCEILKYRIKKPATTARFVQE